MSGKGTDQEVAEEVVQGVVADQMLVEEIVELGISRERARDALVKFNNSLLEAVKFLISQAPASRSKSRTTSESELEEAVALSTEGTAQTAQGLVRCEDEEAGPSWRHSEQDSEERRLCEDEETGSSRDLEQGADDTRSPKSEACPSYSFEYISSILDELGRFESPDCSDSEGSHSDTGTDKDEELYYNGLIQEIRLRLISMCDGINLVCPADIPLYKIKVYYRVLTSYGIPANIQTEEGEIIDPESITPDMMAVFRELAGNIKYYELQAMLNLQRFTDEDYELRLPEAHFLELIVLWADRTQPSEGEVTEVLESVRWSEVCEYLEGCVRAHITTNMGYTIPWSGAQYRYQVYSWGLTPDQMLEWCQWCENSSHSFCCSEYTQYAVDCGIDSCHSVTHPCYTIAVENGYYIVRDSRECNEGGLKSWEDESREGEVGHQHTGSVLWCWALFARKVSDGEWVYTYTSLLLNTKEDIDTMLRERAALEVDSAVSIYVMYSPAHVD